MAIKYGRGCCIFLKTIFPGPLLFRAFFIVPLNGVFVCLFTPSRGILENGQQSSMIRTACPIIGTSDGQQNRMILFVYKTKVYKNIELRWFVRTIVRPFDRPCLRSCVHSCVHPSVRFSSYPSAPPCVHSLVCSFFRPFKRPSIRPSVPPSVRLFLHLPVTANAEKY